MTSPQPSESPLTFASVLETAQSVSAVLPPTPTWSYPLLDSVVRRRVAGAGGTSPGPTSTAPARAGTAASTSATGPVSTGPTGATGPTRTATPGSPTRILVKHENAQPTGAFKVRGGVALMASLDARERHRGVVTASTGNHAQSLAWAGARDSVPVTVVIPVTAPSGKVEAVRALGGRVVTHGPTMTEAMAHAEHLSHTEGLRLVSPGDEPAVVLGHATVYLELFRRHREITTLYVPVGSGSGAAGACLVRDALAPGCRVVGVQSASAPAAYQAWRSGAPAGAPCRTRVSGLATGASFALPQAVMRAGLDDFLLVSDDDVLEAVRLLATCAHTLAEGAGAAALAGLLADVGRQAEPLYRDQYRDQDRKEQVCAVVCTGGNADQRELASLSRAGARTGQTTASPSPL